MGTQNRIGLEAVLITAQFEKGLKQYLAGQKKITSTTQQTAQSAKKNTDLLGQSFSTLGKKIVAFGATLLTLQALKQFGTQAFQVAAQEERLGLATDNLGKRFGVAGSQIVQSIQEASGFTISRLDAMQQANNAMLLGVAQDEATFSRLTKVAVTLGQAMGQTATKSVSDLTLALGRQSPLILDNLGISLKLSEAYAQFAEDNNKLVSQLTDAEKKQAFFTEALRKGEEAVTRLGGVQVTSATQTEALSAAWTDFQGAFGQALLDLNRSTGIIDAVTGVLQNQAAFLRGELKGSISASVDEYGEFQKNLSPQIVEALTKAIEANAAALKVAETGAKKEASALARIKKPQEELNTSLDNFTEASRLAEQSSASYSTVLEQQERAAFDAFTAQQVLNASMVKFGDFGLEAGVTALDSTVALEQARAGMAAQQLQFDVDVDTGAITKSIDDGLQAVKSAIGQVSGLTFDEVLPVQETFRVDEWVRRVAAVAEDGKNEWADDIIAKFGGSETFAPFVAAYESGDPSALEQAAQDIINGPHLLELMDIEGAVAEVESLLAEMELQQRINDAILAAMGGDMPIGTDGESPITSLLGIGEGGDVQAGIDSLTGTSIPGMGVAFTDFGTVATDQVVAISNSINNSLVVALDNVIKKLDIIISKFEEAKKPVEDLGKAISEKLTPRIETATGKAIQLAEALERAARAKERIGGAASGIGFSGGAFRSGVGFQSGTLGFQVPPGFPNDTFPINVTSGERIVVSPPGRSIEQVIGGRGDVSVNFTGPITVSSRGDLEMFASRVSRQVTQELN